MTAEAGLLDMLLYVGVPGRLNGMGEGRLDCWDRAGLDMFGSDGDVCGVMVRDGWGDLCRRGRRRIGLARWAASL